MPQPEDTEEKKPADTMWTFLVRPLVNGMTKEQRKLAKGERERKTGRVIAAKIGKKKPGTAVNLDDVSATLEGSYNLFQSKPIVDALTLPCVEVHGPVSVRPFNVGQSVLSIKAMPQLEKIVEGINAIRDSKNNDLLAYWPDFGSATFDQLSTMLDVVNARNHFKLVEFTTAWIDQVEWGVGDLRALFQDTTSVTKTEYKNYVETLNLGPTKVGNESILGHILLDFRENLWLHTTSILLSLMVLKGEYPGVAIVDPSYQGFAKVEQKRRVAGGCGASYPQYSRVIGVINTNLHWLAFLIDKTAHVCYMFDPLQADSNYKIIETNMRRVMEPILNLEGEMVYERVVWCTQQDGSSCGV